jgi:hypothetical protein
MALYTAGIAVGEISGKVGNVVFTRGRYGPVIRTRAIPTLVQNDYTAAARGRLSYLSQQYGDLTDAQKEAWRTWAAVNQVINRLGQAVTLQPSAAYIQLNARVLQAGGTIINVPPVENAPAAIEGLSLTVETVPDLANVEWTSGALGANERLAVWAAVLDNPGRKYYRNLLKLIYISAAAAATPLDVNAALTERFGTIIDGQKVVVECEVWSDATGLVSGRVYAEDIVETHVP